MKHTLRLLAAPAAAMLLLASCGTTEEPAPAEDTVAQDEAQADAEPSDAGGEEKSSGEIQAEHAKENPDGLPMDDGGDDTEDQGAMDMTDDAGNLVGLEFGDGEQLEFDMEAATGEKPLTPGVRVYGVSEEGGDFVITTQVDPVEDLEAYREKAGAEPVSYMSVDIDNREGVEGINMYQIAVYDAAGNEYIYTGASDAADEWRDLLGSDDVDTYNEGIDLSNTYRDQGASPHQRSTMILTGPELPAEFTAVVAMPRGVFEMTPTTPLKD